MSVISMQKNNGEKFNAKNESKETLKDAVRSGSENNREITVDRLSMSNLKEAFDTSSKMSFSDSRDYYKSKVNNIDYTKQDIEEICKIIDVNEKTGIFISEAINKIIKDGDVIYLDFNGRKVDYLAYGLMRGTVIVRGDAGNYAGGFMGGSAKLEIYGNAGFRTGTSNKDDAYVLVHRDVGDEAGISMSGNAKLEIYGNAGFRTGGYSTDCAYVLVHGDVKDKAGISMSSNAKLEIYGNAGACTGELSRHYINILVHGDVGDKAGISMSGNAKLEIYGNAGACTGELSSDHAYILVHGDVGDKAGSSMSGNAKLEIGRNAGMDVGYMSRGNASILVHGNAGDSFGFNANESARIKVEGNAGDWAGAYLGNYFPSPQDVEIVIEGSAGKNVGERSAGGRIYVSGKIAGLGDGRAHIYQNGKRVDYNRD
jgi:formylmethanofuran dehydrogenase subunit C